MSIFKIKNCWFVICIFLIVACSNHKKQKDQVVQAKPFSDTLRAHIITLKKNNNNAFLIPIHVINLNNDYLILTYLTKNNFIRVIKLPDMKPLYSWGRQGKGPNEFIKPPVYYNHKNDELIIYAWLQRRLITYSVGDSTLKKKGVQSLTYHDQLNPLDRIRRINDSLYFADYGKQTVEKTDHEYIALKPDSKKPLFLFGKYPHTKLKGLKRYFQYIKTNVAQPNGSKFAAFYIYYNKFKIFNKDGKLLELIQIDDPFISNSLKNKKDVLYRNVDYSSNEYIYSCGVYMSKKG